MKTHLAPPTFLKNLVLILVVAIGSMLMSSCSKEDPMVTPPVQNDEVTTRSLFGPEWTCSQCSRINFPWRSYCLYCNKEYDGSQGRLLLSFKNILSNMVKFDNGSGLMTEETIKDRVELPGRIYMEYGPKKWYENATAKRYYTDITKTLMYTSNPDYAEGVDISWYQCVRMLYPTITNHAGARRAYDRFILDEVQNLKGPKGAGIKTGSKAAVDAYGTYK